MSTSGIASLLTDIEAEAEKYLVTRDEGTVIVGLTVRGERHTRSFRSPGARYAPMPGTDSLYEIGSVSKLFTSMLLARLEDEGSVGLDDTIARHLPSSLSLPADVAAITLRQLATHSSGLPPVGQAHLAMLLEEAAGCTSPRYGYHHYLRYRREHLYADLESAKLQFPPGTGWSYSNMGAGLLGHLLELVTATPYEGLVKRHVCEPLGLRDTGYSLSLEQAGRMVHAYDAEGACLPNWYFDVLLPAGGIRSTMSDLLTFLEVGIGARAAVAGSPLARAVRRTQASHHEWAGGLTPGASGAADVVHGLGWRGMELPHGRAWWHPGATLFYLSTVAMDDQAQVGLAVLSSYRDSIAELAPPTSFAAIHQLARDWFQRACTSSTEEHQHG